MTNAPLISLSVSSYYLGVNGSTSKCFPQSEKDHQSKWAVVKGQSCYWHVSTLKWPFTLFKRADNGQLYH